LMLAIIDKVRIPIPHFSKQWNYEDVKIPLVNNYLQLPVLQI